MKRAMRLAWREDIKYRRRHRVPDAMPVGPTFSLAITKQFPLQLAADVITTAVEGGINYWSQVIAYKWTEGPEHTYAQVVKEEDLRDPGDPDHYTINTDVVVLGLTRLLNGEIEVNNQIMGYIRQSLDDESSYMIDADAADIIVQAGLFGKVLFG